MTSFLAFAKHSKKVTALPGSLEKIDLVAAFLSGLDEAELSVACSYVMGTLFPPGLNLVMGVGPSILYEALAKACGCPAEQISEMLRATGDPGLVAAGIVEKRRPIGFAAFQEAQPLSIADVYERFVAIARASGKKSQDIKVKNLQFLFSQASPLEARYIARLAIEDMRIGIGEGGIRDAIARAFAANGATPQSVEKAYNLTNDMGLVASAAREGTLDRLSVMINHPIKMMLATLGESIPAALAEIGTAAVEWKYDGARVQIHKDGDKVKVFSRRLENVTASLPEMVQAARKVMAKSAILDGEAVAVGSDGRPMAFQEILKRFRRKYDVEKLAKKIPLRLFLFDLIYLDGRSLTDLPLQERRVLLEKVAGPDLRADQILSASGEEVTAIYERALEAGHEGLVIKNPTS